MKYGQFIDIETNALRRRRIAAHIRYFIFIADTSTGISMQTWYSLSYRRVQE
jgi:hypothetical protein